MRYARPTALLLAALLGLSQCHDKADPSPNLSPVDQLPPATQEGKNTLGCLVNGKPWIPAGFNGTDNYSIDYDRNPYGVFDLQAYRYENGDSETLQSLSLNANRLYGPKSWSIPDSLYARVVFRIRKTNCEWSSRDVNCYRKGTITVTKLDQQAGIIAGTFDFALAKPGCDTVRVTNGRFDYKF